MKKKLMCLIVIVLFMIFITGCDSSIIKDPNFIDKIKFKENIKVDLKSKVDTTKFIDEVDNIKVNDSSRDSENRIITTNNYVIKCPVFNAEKIGKYKLKYLIGEHKYYCDIEVKDISGPKIKLKSTYEIYQGNSFKLKDVIIDSINDNSTSKNKIKLTLDGKYDVDKVGKYDLKLIAADKYNNKTIKKISLFVYEQPSLDVIDEVTLKVGDNYKIDVKAKGKNSNNLTYDTSAVDVASLQGNIINAKKSGTAIITIKCGNGLSKEIKINVINANKESSNFDKDKKNQQDNSNQNKTQIKPSKPDSSSYNRFFPGNSIDVYNEASEYADSLYSQGKIKGYELMPTGEGFNVICY